MKRIFNFPRKCWQAGVVALSISLLAACGGATKPTSTDNKATVNFDTMSLQDLEAGAKKEGKVVWYGAMVTKELDVIAKKFMEKYPEIKLEYINIGADAIASRVMTEQKGGKFNADVLSASGWPMDQVKRAKALEKYVSPETKSLDKGAVDPDGYWAAHYSLTFPITYNTKKLAEHGLQPPKSYEDLTKPEWKGLFSMDRADYEWYSAMLKAYGDNGKSLIENLAKNKPQIREGHTVLLEGVIAGEYPATIGAYGYKADQEKKKGAPIDYTNLEQTIAVLQPVGIAKNAPHPYAARLFETWLLASEGQKFIFETFGRTPTRPDAAKASDVYNPGKYHYHYSDPSVGAEYDKFTKEYNKIFGIGGQ